MVNTYSALKVQLMATGENNTTWGDITNTNLGTALEEAIVRSATVVFADADQTLTLTDTNASQSARRMRLHLTGSATAGYNLVVPAIQKPYIVNNATDGTITVKTPLGVGVDVPSTKTTWVYCNGTNVVAVVTYLTSLELGTPLLGYSGGTGHRSYRVGDLLYASALDTLSRLADVATGNALISGGVDTAPSWGKVGLTTHVSGTLAVGNGGTGATTLTSSRLLLGNGTSAVSSSIVYDTGTDVGIGDAPSTGFNLDVRAGTGAVTTIRAFNTGTAAGDNTDLYLRNSATGTTATTGTVYFGDGDSASSGYIQYAHTNDRMSFRTNGATAFYLDSAGNGVLTGGLTLGSALPMTSGGTGLATGTSGGILYFSGTTALASSALLTANALMVGGGAGTAPSTVTTGTGVVTALGVNTGSAGAFVVNGGALGTPASGTVTNLTGTASININGTVGATTPAQGTFTNLITNTNDFYLQPNPLAQNTNATLTIANLLASIVTTTSSTAVSLTLPTGILADAGVLGGAAANNASFDWYLINLGSSTGAVTLLSASGHTIVGNAVVAISTSAHFRTRKTAANTFVTYRVS